MGPHDGCTTTAAAMFDWCKKLHRAGNLSFCSYSTFCAYTALRYYATMMNWIGRCKEATDSAWRVPRQQLRSQPPWSGGACLLANLPSKNTLTTPQQRLLTRRDLNGWQRLPWCPTLGAATYNSQSACWLIVVCGSSGSGAPWRQWVNGGHQGRWGTV